MFEHETYSFDTAAEPLKEGDLFYGYEVGRWHLSTRLYSIIAISALLNLGIIGVLAQTNFLTARGCDSPFVGRVCQVLDMSYVAAVLFGTKREYVDAAYETADLSESEVVWIDQTGVPAQFEYPEGYFRLSNPEMFMQPANGTTDPMLPMLSPVTNGSSLIHTPPIAPKDNKNAVPKDLPDLPYELPEQETGSNVKGTKDPKKGQNDQSNSAPGKNTVAGSNSNSGNPDQNNYPVDGVVINKRPIADLGDKVNGLIADKKLDLQTPFTGNAKGRLTKDGRIDPKTLKLLIQSPDPNMQQVVQDGILAIDAAGYLQYLKVISGKDFELVLKQDDQNISAVVQSEMETESRANSIKSSLDIGLALAKMQKQGANADQNDKDDLVLLEGAKIETQGKRVVITFVVPKEVALPMIQRKLAEQAAANKNTVNTSIRKEDNTAVK